MKIISLDFWADFLDYLKKNNNKAEKLALMIAKKSDDEIKPIDWTFFSGSSGIITTEFEIHIPRQLSLSFINVCKKNNYNPIIVHTHNWLDSDYNISFSNKDMLFMKSFVKACRKMEFHLEVIFWVTNGKYYQQCIFNNDKYCLNITKVPKCD